MAGPTKLDCYQMALRHLGDARLALITDDVESRYALDDSWDRATKFVLGQAAWRHALKTATLATDASGIPGYTTGYAYPATWHRTHSIYLASSGRQFPFDLREEGTHILTNSTAAPTMRFVSSTFLDPAAADWPEHFAQTLAAYLAFLVAERVTGDRGAPGKMSQLFASLLPEAVAIDAIDEDPWLSHQRDGSFLRVARTMIDQGFWRFAMVSGQLATVAGGAGGFTRQVAMPADWSRTRSLYVLTTDTQPVHAGERRPFDIREVGSLWLTDATGFYVEYMSATLAMDSTKWPDHYMRAVLRALRFDKAAREGGQDRKDELAIYKDALADTIDSEAVAADPWLAYQLDGSFVRASRSVLARGNWWWAVKTLDIDTSSQESVPAQAGFPYRYALPTDWLKTHSLFVAWDGQECPINIRQTNQDWSSDAAAWTARYVSTDVLNATTWPEMVADAVLAYLDWKSEPAMPGEKENAQEQQTDAAVFQKLLAEALTEYSLAEDPWLRFQLDGRYILAAKGMLEKGRWRFAVKTVILTDPNNTTGSPGGVAGDPNAFSDGSVSPGYSCRMPKPLDWMRTLRLYKSWADGLFARWVDIDYRDELGAIHVNWNPVQLRYVSRLGLDSTQWPLNFRDAVLAWLEYQEARADPKMAAVAARKLEFFNEQCKEAENLDDERDMPRVISGGRFAAGRYGRGRISRENDWPPRG